MSSGLSPVSIANLEEYFPYLSSKNMSEEEISYHRSKLDQQTERVKKSFASLVYCLQDHISTTYKVKDVASYLAFYDPQFKKINLCDCKEIVELFFRLSDYFSFFNHEMIRILTHQFGSETCKKKFKKYRKKFQEYSKRCVCECPVDAFGDVGNKSSCYVIKCKEDMEKFTVKELEKLTYNLNEVLKQNFLRLVHVDRGCIELTLKALTVSTLDLSEETQQELRNVGVLSIHYSAKYYDLQELHPHKISIPGV